MENDNLKFKMKANRNINCGSILHFALPFSFLIFAFLFIAVSLISVFPEVARALILYLYDFFDNLRR